MAGQTHLIFDGETSSPRPSSAGAEERERAHKFWRAHEKRTRFLRRLSFKARFSVFHELFFPAGRLDCRFDARIQKQAGSRRFDFPRLR